MADGHIKIDTRLDNSSIKNDLKELENLVKNGAEQVTDDFAFKVEKLNASWAKLESQQARNNAKIDEYKSKMADLSYNIQSWGSKGPEGGPHVERLVAQYDQVKNSLTIAEERAVGLSTSMSKIGVDAKTLSNSMQDTGSESERVERATAKTNKNTSKGIKNLARWAGALFGIRAIYSGIQRAMTAWFRSTKEGARAQAELQSMWASLGQTLAPVFNYLLSTLKTILGYINAITKAFFGVELFGKSTNKNLGGAVKQAKALKKQLAGFDEANVLSSNENQGTSGGGGTVTAGFELETPELGWLEKIKPLVDTLAASFKTLWDWIKEVSGFIAKYFIKGLETLAGWFGNVDEGVVNLIAALMGLYALYKIFSAMTPTGWVVLAIIAIITAIGWLSENWEEVWTLIKKFVSDTWEAIKTLTANFFSWIGDKITALKDWWVGAWNTIYKAWLDVWNWIYDKWTSMWNWIYTAIANLIKWWVDGWNNIYTKFKEILVGIYNFFKEKWGSLKTWFKTSVIDPITTFFTNMWDKFKTGAVDAWNGVKRTFSLVATFFKDTFQNAWNGVKKVFSSGGTVFKGMKEGILETFKSVVNSLIDGINTIVSIPFKGINTALSGIKNIKILGMKPFDWVGTIKIPKIPKLAKGAIVSRATTAEIGEDGREAVVPLQNNTEWAKDFLDVLDSYGGSMSGGSITIIQQMDGTEIARHTYDLNKEQEFATNGGLKYVY